MNASRFDMQRRMVGCLKKDQQRKLSELLSASKSKGPGTVKGPDFDTYAFPAGEEVYRAGGKEVQEPALLQMVHPRYSN
jgi:hypothetical protein